MSQSQKTRLMIMTALFAALIFVGTRINIPTGIGSHIVHIGDALIYLAACVLPMPYVMLSGAIGAGLSDFTTPNCMVWVIPTILIKPLLVPYFTRNNHKFICLRNIFAAVLAGVTGSIGYLVAEIILMGNVKGALLAFIPGLLQPLGSMIVFIMIGYAFDTLKLQGKLKRQLEGNAS